MCNPIRSMKSIGGLIKIQYKLYDIYTSSVFTKECNEGRMVNNVYRV
jgi:hypothetical protein